jgi:hypothetical protein
MHAMLLREELQAAGVFPNSEMVKRAEAEPSRLAGGEDARDLGDGRQLPRVASEHDSAACEKSQGGDGGAGYQAGLVNDDRREGRMCRVDEVALHDV